MSSRITAAGELPSAVEFAMAAVKPNRSVEFLAVRRKPHL
jgi:hypothetical protein